MTMLQKRTGSEIYEYDREEEMPLQSIFGGILPAKEEDEIDNENSTSSRNMSTIPEDPITLSTKPMTNTISTSTTHDNITITHVNKFKVKELSKQLSLRGLNIRG